MSACANDDALERRQDAHHRWPPPRLVELSPLDALLPLLGSPVRQVRAVEALTTKQPPTGRHPSITARPGSDHGEQLTWPLGQDSWMP